MHGQNGSFITSNSVYIGKTRASCRSRLWVAMFSLLNLSEFPFPTQVDNSVQNLLSLEADESREEKGLHGLYSLAVLLQRWWFFYLARFVDGSYWC